MRRYIELGSSLATENQTKLEVQWLKEILKNKLCKRQYFAVLWELCQMATCAVMIPKLR